MFPVFPLDFCRTRLSTDYKSGTSSRRYRGVASLADATLCGICSGACALALPVLMLKPHSPFSPCARPVQFARVLACVHGHCEDGRLPGSVSRVRHCHDRHRAVSCRYAMCTAADTWHAPLFALFTGHVTLPPVHPPPHPNPYPYTRHRDSPWSPPPVCFPWYVLRGHQRSLVATTS